MAETKKLAKFTITEAGEGFSLHIEDEAGHVLELSATREQIDLIVDTLDDLLEEGDDADEVKDRGTRGRRARGIPPPNLPTEEADDG